MANSSEYWRKRYLRVKEEALVDAEQFQFEMLSRLANASQDIENEVRKWSEKYAKEDGTIDADKAREILRGAENQSWQNTLDEWERKAREGGYDKELNLEYYRSRVSRLQALQAQIMNIMAGYTQPEQIKMLSLLTNTFENTYYRTIFNTQAQQGGFTADFAKLNEEQLQQVVSKNWQGGDFSSRLWGNTTQVLPDMLVKAIGRGVTLGYGVDRMVTEAKVIVGNFNKYQLHRLITTEAGHVAEQATLKAYQESGIKKYEYVATLESRTCDVCRALDGRIYEVSKQIVGENYPLIHPNCRCTTAPVIENKYTQAIDESTNQAVIDVSAKLNERWANSVGLEQVTPSTNVIKTEKVVAKVIKTSVALDKTNMREMVGEVNYTKFADHLDNIAEDKQKALYQLAGDEISFAKMVKSNGYAVRDVVHISQSSFDGKSGFKNPLSTVYHENAHAIDSVVGKHLSKKVGYEIDKISTMNEYDLKTVIDNDFKNYIFKDLEEVKKPRRNSKDFATKYDAYLEYLDEKSNRLNAFKSEMKQIKESKSNVSAMSDMMEAFGAFGDFPLGTGHGHEYWKTLGKQESEFFAEVSEIINADHDQYELIKKVLPNAVGKYHEIIDDAIKTMAEVKGGN
ncbi:minor capsid protein [Weissella soli]|uniref:minor capsid protein n=1 Tax=Weissella soli TaxID=155866 RepID=UPI003C73960D